jgi:hypothetical protein
VVEKSVGAKINADSIPFPPDMNEVQKSPGTFRLAALRAKRCEIMFADEMLRRRPHALDIQGV